MTVSGVASNVGQSTKFRGVFKPRDIFLHDGKSLRRFTVGARVQMAAALLVLALIGWSVFASIRAFAAMTGDVAQMERQVAEMETEVEAIRRETARRAALLEQRQLFLAGMLSGEADPAELARLLPNAPQDLTHPAALAAARNFAEVDGMQQMLVAQAHDATRQRYQETARLVRQLGLNPARLARGGTGGPYEAASQAQNADPRFRELFTSWTRLEQLEQAVVSIPSGKPTNLGNLTSSYGVRSDPFRGSAAMHGGIDIAGPVGTPIYATADGIVARSEYNRGGYGNLVEINHGPGIQTRYGHMSRLIAQPGQRVKRGDLIGLMGSTGRSTGSHLHYEVRIDGRAVNPLPFMQSNETLLALQRRAASPAAPMAIGGPQGGSR